MEVFNGQPKEALVALLGVVTQQLAGHRKLGKSAIAGTLGVCAEDLHIAAAVMGGRAIDYMCRTRIQRDALSGALAFVDVAHEERVALQVAEVKKKAIRGHILGVEAAAHATRKICQRILHLAATADGHPAATVVVRILAVPQSVDLGIGFLHQGRPQDVGEVLGTTAQRLEAVWSQGCVIVHLHLQPDSVLEDAEDVHCALRVVAEEEGARQRRAKGNRIQSFHQVHVVKMSREDSAEMHGVHTALVEEHGGARSKRLEL
mmetsp:Transcript_28652/g.67327  ORF Transcript_28652/g.67327 Transcript_28652/m.67327 type:complete len:261 (+) Transcript_28652:778-1560(+)